MTTTHPILVGVFPGFAEARRAVEEFSRAGSATTNSAYSARIT